MSLTQCETCGASFYVSASRRARGKGRYCSRACHDTARRLPRDNCCAHCGASLLPKRREARYCSRRCAALALHNASQTTVRLCRACRRPFSSSSARDVFCGRVCEARHAAASGKVKIMTDPWCFPFSGCDDDGGEYTRLPDFSLGF